MLVRARCKMLCVPIWTVHWKLEGNSYNIYTANLFSNLTLTRDLIDKKNCPCGIIIKIKQKGNASISQIDKSFKNWVYDYRMDESGVSVTNWWTIKLFTLSQTCLTQHPTKRRKNDGTIGIICRTVVNNAYSKNIGYIEKADMLK